MQSIPETPSSHDQPAAGVGLFGSFVTRAWFSGEVRQIWSDAGTLQTWLEVEAALAEAQAELKLIPLEAARTIRAKADGKAFDLARLAREIGFPDGVINVIPGTGRVTGAALTGHPGIRRMSFTGSPEVGRLVGEACGRNLVPAKLELGGKGAAVVFQDVDVAETAQKLVNAITFNAGQVC